MKKTAPSKFGFDVNHLTSTTLKLNVVDMHTGGEPVRIVETLAQSPSVFPPAALGDPATTILEKRRFAKSNLEAIRKFLMREPRGHNDMYGAWLVEPHDSAAQLAVLFTQNEGYSPMCGHAVIALARYAVDSGRVGLEIPETKVRVECPCGLVEARVDCSTGRPDGLVKFRSVPAYVYKSDITVKVPGYNDVELDVAYGGAFYAVLPASALGLDVRTSSYKNLVQAASAVTAATRAQVVIEHSTDPDLAFLYGTILTDGNDDFSTSPTANICVFADEEVDRSPTGSGVTARIAIQFSKKMIALNQIRIFETLNGSKFTGMAVSESSGGVVVEVGGRAYYSGTSTFVLEENDEFPEGFLLK